LPEYLGTTCTSGETGGPLSNRPPREEEGRKNINERRRGEQKNTRNRLYCFPKHKIEKKKFQPRKRRPRKKRESTTIKEQGGSQEKIDKQKRNIAHPTFPLKQWPAENWLRSKRVKNARGQPRRTNSWAPALKGRRPSEKLKLKGGKHDIYGIRWQIVRKKQVAKTEKRFRGKEGPSPFAGKHIGAPSTTVSSLGDEGKKASPVKTRTKKRHGQREASNKGLRRENNLTRPGGTPFPKKNALDKEEDSAYDRTREGLLPRKSRLQRF